MLKLSEKTMFLPSRFTVKPPLVLFTRTLEIIENREIKLQLKLYVFYPFMKKSFHPFL